MNKDKKVRFVKPITSSRNVPKHTDSLKTKDSNKPLLTSTGVNTTTSASESKPLDNTKKNRISRPPSRNQKNKVEEHTRKVKSSLNKTNSVFEPISNAHVKHSVRNAKFESICVICDKFLFDANHDMCLIDYVNDKPTGRIFTIVENMCSLTRITSTKEVPLKESTITPVITPSLELKVYSRWKRISKKRIKTKPKQQNRARECEEREKPKSKSQPKSTPTKSKSKSKSKPKLKMKKYLMGLPVPIYWAGAAH
ncbi:hypothetical protein Tco_0851975 [Tanacetum coccineum]